MANMGKYDLELITMLDGDERPENDSLVTQVINTSMDLSLGAYSTGFNEVSSLTQMGWSVLKNSTGSTGWRLNTASGQAFSPPNSLNMYRYEGDPDDWAFSNCLRLQQNTYYKVRLMSATRGTNTEEKFLIFLLNQPDPMGEVMQMGQAVVTTFDYVEYEFLFLAPYSGDFHIGLFTDFTRPNTFQIVVDNFIVEKAPERDAAVVDIIQKTWGRGAFNELNTSGCCDS
jgi:hypothetical protein